MCSTPRLTYIWRVPRPASERPSAPKVLSHLGVMLAVAVVMGVVVSGLAIPFAGLVGFTTREVADAMDDLPTELETEPLAEKSTIVDAAGNVIATIYDENRINVQLNQVSRTMVKAIVSIEDSRFYEHGALDLRGTLRALLTNQANADVVQGGSSITQQMVKLTLIDQADTDEEREAAQDDTYARKLKELRYAIALEQKYSKDWILERYLNIALLRRRRLRRPGCRPALLRRQRQGPRPQPVGDPGRAGAEPVGVRPHQLPRPDHRPTRRGARSDGRAQRDQPRQGRSRSRTRACSSTCSRMRTAASTHGRRSSATTS